METTAEHPFFVKGRGWYKAGEFKAGDLLCDVAGRAVTLDKIEVVKTTTTVYNLEVADAHTYFVSDAQLLVHNKPMGVAGLT
ncbi:polymorphic toxin-type HINT domain-containing protein [Anaerohalosphaera lusitana]|uniref:polymorphic toxin-type HINT domain-containing protein n=1 Tax=Anaerohalosphaera lusitana TaxID=1936003 RepID=UPI003AAE4AFE